MDSSPTRPRSTGKRIVTTITILIIIGLPIYIWWHYYYPYSEGYRYGLLQKFSHKGNLFKTYEGEMVLSSVKSNVNVALASEKFYFSVTNKSLAQRLDTLQGHQVTVHYEQKRHPAFWRGDSEYIVDSITHE
jgi:hypothetical protein